MAWIENKIDLTDAVTELRRIADALDRIAGPEPEPWEPGPSKKTSVIGRVDIRGEKRARQRAIIDQET
jgi:hypothetical protein